jgi:ligand-binding sensor domain-containing protein/signal transduction histidine kinase
MRVLILSCILLLCGGCVLHAQYKVEKFTTIGVEQGLSHFRVYDCLKDTKGYLWIATMDGLDRYDGYEFTVFRHDESDPTTLNDNVVTALCLDSSGAIWVGSRSGVLHRFVESSETFQRYTLSATGKDTGAADPIHAMCCDPAGSLWVSTRGSGLWRIVPPGGDGANSRAFAATVFRHDQHRQESLSDDNVYSVTITRDGSRWISTNDGLDELLQEGKSFRHYRHAHGDGRTISNSIVYQTIEDMSGTLWIATDDGLDAFNRSRQRMRHYRNSPADSTSLVSNMVTSLYEESERWLWVGTRTGLSRLDRQTGLFTSYHHNDADVATIADDLVMRIFGEPSGNIWILNDRGISKWNSDVSRFGYVRHTADYFAHQSVSAVLEDSRGVLWLGTDAGMRVIHREKSFPVRPVDADFRRLSDEYVQSFLEDRSGTVWIGTMSALYRYTRDGDLDRVKVAGKSLEAGIMALAQDSTGTLWIGTMSDGLYALDPLTGEALHYHADPALPDGPGGNYVTSLCVDRYNTLWIGTEGSGLDMVDLPVKEGERLAFQHLRHDLARPNTPSNNRIHALLVARDGTLWISTGDGLDKYNRETGIFVHVLNLTRLPHSSNIISIVEDDRGSLWLGTILSGLWKFSPDTQELICYDAEDGLQSNRFYYGGTRLRTGELLFGGERGYNLFHPDSIRRNGNEPLVVCTKILVHGKPISLSFLTREGGSLELPYDQNFVTFELASLDLTQPRKNLYKYMLAGLEEKWSVAGPSRLATYTNLPPGHYTFKGMGSNNGGAWSRSELNLALVIQPPYWGTWWFRGLVVMLIAALLFAFYRYRVARLLELQRMRLRIASDLHDDIGSSLGSIALTSDMMQLNSDLPAGERKQLAEMSRAARTTAEALRDIVWVINPSSDTMDSLLLKLKDEASALLQGTDHVFDVSAHSERAILSMELRHNIILVFKEALHNIVKHSGATFVRIGIEWGEHFVKLRIEDNGKGFDAINKGKGNGLASMKRRGEKLGHLEMMSESGKGTTVSLEAKIP